MDLLLELVLELVLEIVLELMASSVSAQASSRIPIRQRHPVLSFLAYTLMGALLGSFTVWIFPSHFMRTPSLRVLTLIVSPLIAGWIMFQKGQWAQKNGKKEVGLDRFWCGTAFAFMFMLIRFIYAQ